MANIRQIRIGSTTYDIDAVTFAGKTEQEWKDLIEVGFDIVFLSELPAETASTYEEYHNKLVLTPSGEEESDPNAKDEWIITRSGSVGSYTYKWEIIGCTIADFNGFAKENEAVRAGSYTTSTPNTNATGAAGAATITTSSVAGYTATGSAEISYEKANNATGEAGAGTSDDTGAAGAFTINGSNFSFSGTSVTLTQAAGTGTLNLDKHVYQPEGSISGSQTIESHSHAVNVASVTAGIQEAVVSGITHAAGSFSQGAKASFSQGAKATLSYTARADVMCSPTVADGVLSWSSVDCDDITAWTANGDDTFTPNGDDAFTPGSLTFATVSVLKDIPAITLSAAGAATIAGSNFSFSGVTATLQHTQAGSGDAINTVNTNIPAVNIVYTPAGSISGSQEVAAHSHSYLKPVAHTHSIGLSTVTATGSVAVAISAHSHEVEIASHTHDLSNHTHGITLDPISDK